MSAGPLVVTYPLTGRSRAIVAEELGGAMLVSIAFSRAAPTKPLRSTARSRQPPPNRDEHGIENDRSKDRGVGRRDHAPDP
jgi:hypothetical protein